MVKKTRPQPVRTPQVRAAVCEKNANHKNTNVYRTVGQTRYCLCNDCGHTWKQTGPEADVPKSQLTDAMRRNMETLADQLSSAPTRRSKQDGTLSALVEIELHRKVIRILQEAAEI